MQCNWLLDHFEFLYFIIVSFVFKQPMLSMQRELIGCLLLKFWLTLGSVVSTPQLCALAEWYSLTSGGSGGIGSSQVFGVTHKKQR